MIVRTLNPYSRVELPDSPPDLNGDPETGHGDVSTVWSSESKSGSTGKVFVFPINRALTSRIAKRL